ncbi:MerR family transcriptional regulator [bacterium]|nr:MerR family transcriptional regulator [bacterium]
MIKQKLLNSFKNKEYSTLDELVIVAAQIIPHIASEQKRYRVSVYPDERTVRYYINEGLVDKPYEVSESSSRFTYRHLLQILIIKHLQAQYLSLNKIKDMIKDMEEERMEELIISGQNGYSEYSRLVSPMDRKQKFLNENKIEAIFREKVSFKKVKEELKVSQEWLRVVVKEGVELNIRTDIIKGSREDKEEFLEKIAARLRIYLDTEKNR